MLTLQSRFDVLNNALHGIDLAVFFASGGVGEPAS